MENQTPEVIKVLDNHEPQPPKKPNRWLGIVLPLAVTALLAGAYGLYYQSSQEPEITLSGQSQQVDTTEQESNTTNQPNDSQEEPNNDQARGSDFSFDSVSSLFNFEGVTPITTAKQFYDIADKSFDEMMGGPDLQQIITPEGYMFDDKFMAEYPNGPVYTYINDHEPIDYDDPTTWYGSYSEELLKEIADITFTSDWSGITYWIGHHSSPFSEIDIHPVHDSEIPLGFIVGSNNLFNTSANVYSPLGDNRTYMNDYDLHRSYYFEDDYTDSNRPKTVIFDNFSYEGGTIPRSYKSIGGAGPMIFPQYNAGSSTLSVGNLVSPRIKQFYLDMVVINLNTYEIMDYFTLYLTPVGEGNKTYSFDDFSADMSLYITSVGSRLLGEPNSTDVMNNGEAAIISYNNLPNVSDYTPSYNLPKADGYLELYTFNRGFSDRVYNPTNEEGDDFGQYVIPESCSVILPIYKSTNGEKVPLVALYGNINSQGRFLMQGMTEFNTTESLFMGY